MRVLKLLFVGSFVVACKPAAPVKTADHDSVVAAQHKWCVMMAELEGSDGSWSHHADCDAAMPTGSAQYVERMVDCFRDQKRDYGDNAPDSGAIIDACTVEVLAGVDPGDVSDTGVMKARCERMIRCQQLDQQACRGINERLDGSTKALLTSMYNLQAQGEIAKCLADEPCTDDEDRAHDACYRKQRGYRVWLPL